MEGARGGKGPWYSGQLRSVFPTSLRCLLCPLGAPYPHRSRVGSRWPQGRPIIERQASGSNQAPKKETEGQVGRGRTRLKLPLPGPSGKGRPGAAGAHLPMKVSQPPPGGAHLSWSSRPSGVVAPIPPGGGSGSGEMLSLGHLAEGERPQATQPRPVASNAARALVVPWFPQRQLGNITSTGDRVWERAGTPRGR